MKIKLASPRDLPDDFSTTVRLDSEIYLHLIFFHPSDLRAIVFGIFTYRFGSHQLCMKQSSWLESLMADCVTQGAAFVVFEL